LGGPVIFYFTWINCFLNPLKFLLHFSLTLLNRYEIIVWEGYLIAPETGSYSFEFQVDDGVLIYLSGQLMLSEWIQGVLLMICLFIL